MYALVKRKEDPANRVSLLDLLRLHRRLSGAPDDDASIREEYAALWQVILDFYRDHPEYHRVRYEDFVAGELADLEAYLGFPLTGDAEVAERHRRVVRTKSAGDWRRWFLPEDVAFFRPLYDDFLHSHGYDTDWSLPDAPAPIPPEHASEYFYRLLSEKRALILRPVSRERLAELAAIPVGDT